MNLEPRASAGKHTILVVDDEEKTVTSVRHLLRRRYHVLGATRAQDALAMLARQPVSVVLCDQRMPEMTGDQFFEQVRQRHDHTVRIMITAYADMEALIRSVNRGHIFGYLRKPWDPAELERVVETAVSYRELVEANRRMTAELADANHRLQRINQEMRDFTHSVAHDFKEPLRSISAFAEFLSADYGDALEPDGRGYLDRILRCSRHLEGLVNDVMRFGELDRTPPEPGTVDLGAVIDEVCEVLHAAIRRQDAEVVIDKDLPRVRGDHARLVLLFQNLLSNAIKFNRTARPRVEIGATRSDGQAVVHVRDNGIGIPRESQDRIFNIFERLHGRAEFPGSGAGLAIVRKVVDSLGGAVHVESSPGQGATFFVQLQLAD